MTLIHIVAGNAMGGAQRYALDICRHYAQAGHDVKALTRDAKAVDAEFTEAGISLVHAPLRDYPDLFSALTLAPLLRNAPSGREPVVVHTHRYRDALTAITARRIARRGDVRIVVTSHHCKPGKDNWLRRIIYRQTDANIFVSEFARNRFLSAWDPGRYPFDPVKLHVVFNSRNVPQRDPVPEPAKGAVTAMYHGTLRQGKGVETIISAMSMLKDTRMRLKIAGTGDPDYIDRLRRLSLRLGVMDSIDWVRNAADPTAIIEGCHFGVLPSEEPEAFGMANIEYMALGRPQICTLNGGPAEYITPGVEAIAVPAADAGALAEAMRTLGADRELRIRMGEAAAHSYSESLCWTKFIEKIDKIYGLK